MNCSHQTGGRFSTSQGTENCQSATVSDDRDGHAEDLIIQDALHQIDKALDIESSDESSRSSERNTEQRTICQDSSAFEEHPWLLIEEDGQSKGGSSTGRTMVTTNVSEKDSTIRNSSGERRTYYKLQSSSLRHLVTGQGSSLEPTLPVANKQMSTQHQSSKWERKTTILLGVIAFLFFGLFVGLVSVMVLQDNQKVASSNTNADDVSDSVKVDDSSDGMINSIKKPCKNKYPEPPPFPGKKGAALKLGNGNKDTNLPMVLSLNPYWNYNWNNIRIESQPEDIEYVPMLWGGGSQETIQQKLFENVVPFIKSGQVKRLLGFNKPDSPKQANMDVSRAIELWPELEGLDIPLVSPSCEHPGRDWMEEFMENAIKTCSRVDWVGVTWYGGPDFDSFRSYLISLNKKYRRKIVVSEFAVADWEAKTRDENRHSPASVLAFMKQALPWLESKSWIAGYVWFSFKQDEAAGTSSALFDSEGGLTDLGRYYASVRTDLPGGDLSIGSSTNVFEKFTSLPQPIETPAPSPSPTCLRYPLPPPLPGKKGAALTLRDEGKPGDWKEHLPRTLALNPYWNYSWSSKRIAAQPDDIEFIPMLWGGGKEGALEERIRSDILPHVESGKVKRVLGFNEPDHKMQSNMQVSRALELWPQLESLGVPLVSPSCAHPGKQWMQDFMVEVEDSCKRVDWVGVHWYGSANFPSFVKSMTSYHQQYGRPILITEFAPADWSATSRAENNISPAEVLSFMKQALPWLEEQDWVVGYAWFSFKQSDSVGTSSALFDTNGELTACGRFYATVRTDNPQGDLTIQPGP